MRKQDLMRLKEHYVWSTNLCQSVLDIWSRELSLNEYIAFIPPNQLILNFLPL